MEPVPKHPRLMRRGGQYSLRAKVPDELKPIIGKREIWQSLKTADHRLALKRVRVASVEVDAQFDAARRKLRGGSPDGVTSPTDAELHQIVVTWFRNRQQLALDRFDTPCHVDVDRQGVIATLREQEAGLVTETEYMPAAQLVVRKLLLECGLTLDEPDGRQFWLTVRLVHRALIEETRRALVRYQGQLDERSHEDMFRNPSRPPEGRHHTATRRGPRITLGQLIQRYQTDPSRARLRPRTREAYVVVFRVLEELLGAETLVDEITRDDCRRVRDVLIDLPRHARIRVPGVALARAADNELAKGLPRLQPKTISNHLNNLSALFKWAAREEYITHNPAAGLDVSNSTHRTKGKEPFNADQLRAIFSAPLYVGCQDDQAGYAKSGPNRPRRGRFWVPILGALTGMRLNEICQLSVNDIVVRDETDVILVRESADGEQRIKTRASERAVPIHPILRRIGFLDHVAKMREAGEHRIFPELKKGVLGNYSDPFQKWFSRFLVHAGADRPRTSFHSQTTTMGPDSNIAPCRASLPKSSSWSTFPICTQRRKRRHSCRMSDSKWRADCSPAPNQWHLHPGLDQPHAHANKQENDAWLRYGRRFLLNKRAIELISSRVRLPAALFGKFWLFRFAKILSRAGPGAR